MLTCMPVVPSVRYSMVISSPCAPSGGHPSWRLSLVGGEGGLRCGMAPSEPLRLATRSGRWVVVGTVLGSGIASLDATVVNVALPRLATDLGADFADLQWVLNGYMLSLAAFILVGGSLGDRFGRRKIFSIGVVGFALASLLCGVAPNVDTLIAARVLQGAAGALLRPGQPGDPPGVVPPRRPGQGDRRVVRLRRRHHGARSVPRRLAGQCRLVAARLPPQPAIGRASSCGSPPGTSPRAVPPRLPMVPTSPGPRSAPWGSPG